jgi:hypothetical protein
MNDNLIDWIDNHWDVIRNQVFSYDMNKFKEHVTMEINSLGIFSLTVNSTLLISMVCISNLLSFKNIVVVLAPLTNLIFTVLSSGLILIGFYSAQHGYYTGLPTWNSRLIILLGFVFMGIGILGYYAMSRLNRKWLLFHIVILALCLILLIFACFGFFVSASNAGDIINENWKEISANLAHYGYEVRKSFMVNQTQINLKFAGFYSLVFTLFSVIALATSIYQRKLI